MKLLHCVFWMLQTQHLAHHSQIHIVIIILQIKTKLPKICSLQIMREDFFSQILIELSIQFMKFIRNLTKNQLRINEHRSKNLQTNESRTPFSITISPIRFVFFYQPFSSSAPFTFVLRFFYKKNYSIDSVILFLFQI